MALPFLPGTMAGFASCAQKKLESIRFAGVRGDMHGGIQQLKIAAVS